MSSKTTDFGTLRASLDYEPQVLKFGTSGRRGEVVHLTQLEIYLNALAELEYLQSLPPNEGGIIRGDEFFFAFDLRPSSSRFVPEQQGRGGLAQAIQQAIRDAGMQPVNLGRIPTPALTFFALQHRKGSMMITGSHIPFERNGYKTNTAKGELLKQDEAPINARVEQVRQRLYTQPCTESIFDRHGFFKDGLRELLPENGAAREAYLRRYRDFFSNRLLKGKRLLVYQHSAVGRDLLVEILQRLGAEAIPAGRSETFVPIDTENIDEAQLSKVQSLANEAAEKFGPLDAVVSTDGDSDRPLILGVEPASNAGPGAPGRVRFFGGDLVGMIVAEYLGADAVVVPISCNDAIDRGTLKVIVEPKTRIGSPFVIAGMDKARVKGHKIICGWEANGGFLTGSDIERNGKVLQALPTRDAILPILGVLASAAEKGLSLTALFDQLPKRFSRAALLKHFPRPVSLKIVEWLSPANGQIKEAAFDGERVTLWDEDHREMTSIASERTALLAIRETLHGFFAPALGFGQVIRINYIDGVRVFFANADVAHVRPSGNADELRIYAVADTQARADAVADMGVAEPDGILKRLEKAVNSQRGEAAIQGARTFLSASNGRLPPKRTRMSALRPNPRGIARFSGVVLQAGSVAPGRVGNAHSEEQYRQAVIAGLQAHPSVVVLQGTVQHYDWGGFDFIPSLLGMTNASRKPFAELWMGSHAKSPAMVEVGAIALPLTQLLERAAPAILGSAHAVRFEGRLPYLFKVLDARTMLSIQAHPSQAQAQAGYERETQAGIALQAPERNCQDRNHKPEVHVALTDLWMLHGFRPLEEIAAVLGEVPEFRSIVPNFSVRLAQAGGLDNARQALLRDLYQTVMNLPQAAVDSILNPLISRLEKIRIHDKNQPDYWALRAAEIFSLPGGHRDRGIFSIYLLNLLQLKPGQGTYQPAGTLHAYLEGVNVELMANSDNVLRGGLTSKRVDVAELMNVLSFASGRPEILAGEAISATETVYRTPAEEFELSRLRVTAGKPHSGGAANGPEILLVVEGDATLRAGQQSLGLKRGRIVLVPCGCSYLVEAANNSAVLFKAGIPRI